jgi:HEAT repeat protein
MNILKKYWKWIAGLAGAIVSLLVWSIYDKPDAQHDAKQTEAPQIVRQTPPAKPLGSLLKYDPLKDPRFGGIAADNYYKRRDSMIREVHGDGQIDKPLAVLKSGNGSRSELVSALGSVTRHETMSSLPFVVNLLNHTDLSVRRVAAKTLCWFGDKRGFNFLLEQCKKPGGAEWDQVFKTMILTYKPAGYEDEIKELMKARNGEERSQQIEVYEFAKVLAALGDPASLDVLLPNWEKYPPEDEVVILALRLVDDPRVMELARSLVQNGVNAKMKQTAGMVMAARGDQAAQAQIIQTADRVIGLPHPQKSDGSYKPELKQQFIGEPSPTWDAEAVYALEEGMSFVPPEQAVPLLKKIANSALNVRFSEMAIRLLAKIGSEAAREALWETAQTVQLKARPFEDTIFTATGKALALFADDKSLDAAKGLFGADTNGFTAAQFIAETKGWDGLFNQSLFF